MPLPTEPLSLRAAPAAGNGLMNAPFRPRAEDHAYLRRLAYTLAIAAVLIVAWRAADLLLLVFGAVLAAVVFRSMGELLEKLGLRNADVALGIGIVLCLCIVGLMGYLLMVQFGVQVAGLIDNLPETVAAIENAVGSNPVGAAVVKAVRAAVGGSAIADRLGDLIAGTGEVILNFLIVLVGGMFIAANPGPYRRAIVMLTPHGGRTTMDRALGEMAIALRLWLKAKLISMTAMTVLIGGSLWAAGVEHWAALGLLGGISEFVPYVGPAVAMLPAIAIAAGQGGSVLTYTLIAYVAVRVIEAWMITPLINRQVVSIPPALTLFVILGAGAVFGLYGVFFAGALLVVAYVGVRELYLRDTLGEAIDGVPRTAKE
ncbi:AI-2E family transporter [Croceicoccus bisphenolivorans]|uniref:AI-2E family transporter n=1 Tax=Croceicoccus bisphenolivorans TaxID=1783232 RepID=UPI000AF7F27B|nr:AI-2E family transporter [Croceicoccus bisphenolivorans]